jgi:predicted NUDIX family phosphoesterase
VALINDLSNPVSRDHLGVLFVIDLPVGEQVTIRETDKMAVRFLPLKQIVSDYYDRLESWSKLVVNFLVNSGGAISD